MAISRFDHIVPTVPTVPTVQDPLAGTVSKVITGNTAHSGYFVGPYNPPVPPEQPHRDFVLWLNGAVDLLDSTPPSQAQWDRIRARTAEHVSAIVYKLIKDLAAPETVLKPDATSG